jgi:GNAT superfamily N-acetyltransferase
MGDDGSPRDLGDGLVLRWASPTDTERVVAFNAVGFRRSEDGPPDHRTGAHVRDFMSGRNPLVGAEDFVFVEDRRAGAIVASTCLMRQRWSYEGIPFDVGRPEFVVTDPAYRRRGLIRALFEAIHARSAGRGELAQGITGIPYFYRQFGYEYALDLEGGRIAPLATLPAAPEGEGEAFTLRPATPDDLPLITELYDRRRARLAVSAVVPGAFWRSLFGAPRGEYNTIWDLRTIVDAEGAACGYARVGSMRWEGNFWLWDLAVRDGLSLRTVGLPVLRALRRLGEEAPASAPDAPPYTGLMLALEPDHLLFAALGEAAAPRVVAPYAWYVRVPDLPAFLRHIAPALERRLAASPLAGHTGELRLDFYRDGLRLRFADGRLTEAGPWRRPVWGEAPGANFPPLVFLQLLFGRRSLAELRAAFPDVRAGDEGTALLDALFPKQVSRVDFPE